MCYSHVFLAADTVSNSWVQQIIMLIGIRISKGEWRSLSKYALKSKEKPVVLRVLSLPQ